MANNERGEAAPDKKHKTETFGTLNIMVTAGNDEINKSYKRKFEEITGKLQVIEESVAKILRTHEDEKKLRETSRKLNNQMELNSEKRFVLNHVFKNVAALEIGVPCFSKVVEKFNLKWNKLIERNEKHLGFVLFCEPVAPIGNEFAVEIKAKFRMMSDYLALQSALLNYLFCEEYNVPENAEIELTEIEANDFHNFLELIHGGSSIDDDTVTGLLDLADSLEAPTAIRRCEEFLLKDSQKSIVQKLQLALRCHLENLKSKCLSEISEKSDIEAIISANIPEMNLSTSQALLQKSIAIIE
ncbi:unnamed protein product [Caenorhabditis nigoni]